MTQKIVNKILILCTITILLLSCTSKLDFNQVNDTKLTPVYVTDLAYFEVPANLFVVGGIEHNQFSYILGFNVFKDKFLKTNLKKVEFFFEVNNTINRAYTVNLYLLDSNNIVLHTFQINIPAYTGTDTGNTVAKTEIFENTDLDLLKNTTRLGSKVIMLPGTSLTETSLGSIKLRSSATVYLEVK